MSASVRRLTISHITQQWLTTGHPVVSYITGHPVVSLITQSFSSAHMITVCTVWRRTPGHCAGLVSWTPNFTPVPAPSSWTLRLLSTRLSLVLIMSVNSDGNCCHISTGTAIKRPLKWTTTRQDLPNQQLSPGVYQCCCQNLFKNLRPRPWHL